MQIAVDFESSTGVASMCMSPNTICAAAVLERGGAMEIQIFDLDREDVEHPDVKFTANR